MVDVFWWFTWTPLNTVIRSQMKKWKMESVRRVRKWATMAWEKERVIRSGLTSVWERLRIWNEATRHRETNTSQSHRLCCTVCCSVLQCAKVCYSGGRGCRGEGVCWSGVGEGLRVSPRFCLSPTFAFAYQGSLNQSISASLTPDKNLYFFQHISLLVKRDTHDDNWEKGMPRINWVMQMVGKRRHRVIGSLPIARARRSDQRWSSDYRRNIGRWSIRKRVAISHRDGWDYTFKIG